MRVGSSWSMRMPSTRPIFRPPANRTASPGCRPPANLKEARYVVLAPPNAPLSAKTVASNTAATINTNNPTNACSRFASMVHLSGGTCCPASEPGRRGRNAFLPTSGPVLFGQHLQIVQLLEHFGLRYAVQELPDARVRVLPQLLPRAEGHDIPLVEQQHAIGDQESARQLVGHYHDGYPECLLELQDQVVDPRGDDRVQTGRGLVEKQHFRVHGHRPGHRRALLHPAAQLRGHVIFKAR